VLRIPGLHRGLRVLLLVLYLAPICGCGRTPTASVDGSVSYQGGLFEGRIVFTPSGDSTERKSEEGIIHGGRYEIPSLSPGTKAVEIYSSEPVANPNDAPAQPSTYWIPSPRTVEVQPGSQSINFSVTGQVQ
jgi:hypothetical protein